MCGDPIGVVDANVSVRYGYIAPFTATARLCGLLLLVASAARRRRGNSFKLRYGADPDW